MPEENNIQGRIYRPNTFQMPNVMIDQWLTELSGSEFKVAAYICRHTYGWNKESDGISLSQMMNGIRRRDGSYLDRGTGIKSKETLLTALRSLEKQGRIRRDRRRSIERGDEPTVYRLVIVDEEPREEELTPGEGGGLKTGHPVGGKSDQGGGKNFRPGGWSEIPTTQNTLEQNTSLQNPSKSSNNIELPTQTFNGVSTFEISKKQIEFLENDEAEEEASDDEPEEQRRGDYQPLTPSTNSGFSAVGEVLKSRRVGSGRKSASRSSKTAPGADSSARTGVRQGRGKSGLPEPPEWLVEQVTRLSDELHDLPHAEGNIGQAHNLFLYTGAEERRFQDRLTEAKRLTMKYDIEKRAEGEAGEYGLRNKMPYFFKVLRDVLGLKDIPASETKPKSIGRRGRRQAQDVIRLGAGSAPT